MAFNLTAAGNILKTRYLGPIREQMNGATILLKRLGRDENSLSVSGKDFTIPLHVSRNTSAGTGISDGGSYATAGEQGYQVAVVPNAYLVGRINITGPTIKAARDNAGAFVTAVESEVKGMTNDFKKAVNRQILGDGTDALAFWTGTDDASGATVDDGQGNAFVHLPASGTITCDLIDATDYSTELGSDIVVTLGAKAAANYAITWTGTVAGSADGDYLVVANTHKKQMMGIDGIISDADPHTLSGGLHGLTVAANPWWKAQVFGNSGTKRDLTLPMMQEPLSAISVNSNYSEADVQFMLCNYNIRDKYVALLVADKRYVNSMTLDGGFSAVEFNGIPLVPDPQCKRGTIYYPVLDTLKIYRTSDFDWKKGVEGYLMPVAGSDSYEAVMYTYCNLGCSARNANAKLSDLND